LGLAAPGRARLRRKHAHERYSLQQGPPSHNLLGEAWTGSCSPPWLLTAGSSRESVASQIGAMQECSAWQLEKVGERTSSAA
jgi:hypothetical protein